MPQRIYPLSLTCAKMTFVRTAYMSKALLSRDIFVQGSKGYYRLGQHFSELRAHFYSGAACYDFCRAILHVSEPSACKWRVCGLDVVM